MAFYNTKKTPRIQSKSFFFIDAIKVGDMGELKHFRLFKMCADFVICSKDIFFFAILK